jgi:hypothetical protein
VYFIYLGACTSVLFTFPYSAALYKTIAALCKAAVTQQFSALQQRFLTRALRTQAVAAAVVVRLSFESAAAATVAAVAAAVAVIQQASEDRHSPKQCELCNNTAV